MANKISGVDAQLAPVSAGKSTQRARDATTKDSAQSSADASPDVNITFAASSLDAVAQSLLEQPAVDETRVAEVRSAIDQGRYTIDSGRIADAMVRMEQSLSQLEK